MSGPDTAAERRGPRAGRQWPAVLRQVARFASWGVVNTLVDFVLYVALAAAGVPVLAANFASTSAGLAVSFYGNRRFVFGGTGRTVRELVLFLVVAGVGVWAIQPAVIWATTPAVSDTRWAVPGVALWLPKVIAIGVAAVWNFFLYKYVVFARPGADRL